MMKTITLSKIGYNAPNQANWTYGIWKMDLIDTKQSYCMSHTFKENFGGDSRLKQQCEALGVKLIETKGIYTDTGTPKITGINKLPYLDSDEAIKIVKEFISKK